MSVRRTLKTLVADKKALLVPGAYDGVSARLVERAGFPAAYMTGFGTSASRLGLPDLGYAGLAEMADHARNLAAAVSIPLIADADTGYGNALGVRRTVQVYEAAGVAGLHIEDQVAPKRCGHLSGHHIVPRGEFALGHGQVDDLMRARTIASGVDMGRARLLPAVDDDLAVGSRLHPGCGKIETGGVGLAPEGIEAMRRAAARKHRAGPRARRRSPRPGPRRGTRWRATRDPCSVRRSRRGSMPATEPRGGTRWGS